MFWTNSRVWSDPNQFCHASLATCQTKGLTVFSNKDGQDCRHGLLIFVGSTHTVHACQPILSKNLETGVESVACPFHHRKIDDSDSENASIAINSGPEDPRTRDPRTRGPGDPGTLDPKIRDLRTQVLKAVLHSSSYL